MHAPAIAVATRRMIVPAAVAFLVAWWPCGAVAAAGWPPPASGGGARGRAGWPGRCVNMALCCGQARRRAAFPGHAGPGGPGRLPGFAQRFLPAARIRAVITQPVGAGTVFHGSAGLAACTWAALRCCMCRSPHALQLVLFVS